MLGYIHLDGYIEFSEKTPEFPFGHLYTLLLFFQKVRIDMLETFIFSFFDMGPNWYAHQPITHLILVIYILQTKYLSPLPTHVRLQVELKNVNVFS